MSIVLPTTISQARMVAPSQQPWAPWLLEVQALVEAKQDAVRLAIRDGEPAGASTSSPTEK